ncbi:MAG: hypothetical protein V2A79_00515 [Planctomycetota bacterium]
MFATGTQRGLAAAPLGRNTTRVTDEVPGVNRVVHDVSSKPSATGRRFLDGPACPFFLVPERHPPAPE